MMRVRSTSYVEHKNDAAFQLMPAVPSPQSKRERSQTIASTSTLSKEYRDKRVFSRKALKISILLVTALVVTPAQLNIQRPLRLPLIPPEIVVQSVENDSRTDTDRIWDDYFLEFETKFVNITMGLLKLFNCPSYSDQTGIEQPRQWQQIGNYSKIPTTNETWKLFENAYYHAMGIEQQPQLSQVKVVTIENEFDNKRIMNIKQRGFQVPHEIKYRPIIGRGVYETEFIRKGETIALSTHVISLKRKNYRKFIEFLHHESSTTAAEDYYDWTCDALMWTFQSGLLEDKSTLTHCIGLDATSLFNDAKGNESAENVEFIDLESSNDYIPFGLEGLSPRADFEAECQFTSSRAARDIQPGEGMFRFKENITILLLTYEVVSNFWCSTLTVHIFSLFPFKLYQNFNIVMITKIWNSNKINIMKKKKKKKKIGNICMNKNEYEQKG